MTITLPDETVEKIREALENARHMTDGITADLCFEALALLPAAETAGRHAPAPLDPDMPAQELRLHMGELTAGEVLVARAAIRWANSARTGMSGGE